MTNGITRPNAPRTIAPSNERDNPGTQVNGNPPPAEYTRRSNTAIYTPIAYRGQASGADAYSSTFSAHPGTGNRAADMQRPSAHADPVRQPAATQPPVDLLSKRNLTEQELRQMTRELWGTRVLCVGHGVAGGPDKKIWRDPITPGVLKIYHPEHGVTSARNLNDAVAQLRTHGTLTRADLHQQRSAALAEQVLRDFGDAAHVLVSQPALPVLDRVEMWLNENDTISGRTPSGEFHARNYARAFEKLMEDPDLRALHQALERGLQALQKSVLAHWQGQVTVSAVQPPLDCLPITVWPLASGEVGLHGPGYPQLVLQNMQEVEQVLRERGVEPGMAAPRYVAAIFNPVAAQYWDGKVKVGEPKHGELHRHPRVWLMADGLLGAKLRGQSPQLHLTADDVERYFNANHIFSNRQNHPGSDFSGFLSHADIKAAGPRKPLLDRLADRVRHPLGQTR